MSIAEVAMTAGIADTRPLFLSTLPPGRVQRRLGLGVVIVSAAIFVTAAPFAKTPLMPVWAFIPIYETALVVNDLITAVLLFGQFGFLRSRALLVLAGGYLFTALMTVSHALTFPGLFSPTGWLGAGPQSTAWLYMFWHGVFPLYVIAYARLADSARGPVPPQRAPVATAGAIGATLVLTTGLTLLATAGQHALPAIMRGHHYTAAMIVVVSSTWALSLLALAVLWRRRSYATLDLWLMVVMCAWLFDIGLAAVLNAGRFDLGFYAGRVYGLLAASFVLMVLLFENGKLYARLLAAHDSEQRERRRVQESEAEAAQANRAKSEFLSRMSHELRTPLNGIIGFSQLLQLDALTPEQLESVGHIHKAGRHLLSLINEVLDIARIEAGKITISLEPVLVSDAMGSALDLVRPQAKAAGVEIRDGIVGDAFVIADRQRLQQVLLNLLSNAVKYNRPGGTVAVSCHTTSPGKVELAVRDTGRGIAPEMLRRLYTPFERLGADQSSVEGTGLGLALSKRLVEAMGGALRVESEVGVGTTFAVELSAGAPLSLPSIDDRATSVEGQTASARGTLLYIEDNVANLRLVERIVARRPGVTLLSAMQGSQGLELARAHRPGAILLDLHLPDLHGTEVLARLRADAATRDIPVVVLTADATGGQMSRLLEQGARAYLTKPLDVVQLLALIDELFDGARL